MIRVEKLSCFFLLLLIITEILHLGCWSYGTMVRFQLDFDLGGLFQPSNSMIL